MKLFGNIKLESPVADAEARVTAGFPPRCFSLASVWGRNENLHALVWVEELLVLVEGEAVRHSGDVVARDAVEALL